MKIAVACDRPEPVGFVSPCFGRSDWFLVYDTRADRFSLLRHQATQEDAGIRAARRLVGARISAVVAGDFGASATRVLHDARVCLFSAGKVTVVSAIAAFQRGHLIDL